MENVETNEYTSASEIASPEKEAPQHQARVGKRPAPEEKAPMRIVKARMSDVPDHTASHLEASPVLSLLRHDGKSICAELAAAGAIRSLAWLRARNVPWDEQTALEAAAKGRADCLRYLLENGCPHDWKKICAAAAAANSWKCLKLARHRWDALVPASAAAHGHLSLLQKLRRERCIWDERACIAAIEWGWMDCLEFLLTHNCPYGIETWVAASRRGSVSCLKLLANHGQLGDVARCIEAATEGGHLDCVDLLRHWE